MTDLTQMIRWNANFVRGLAQSVLERAKVIRSTLTPYTSEATPIFTAPKKSTSRRLTVKKAAKKTSKKVSKPVRKSKKAHA
ncbi:MAG: hypothetical protein ACXVA9_11250 [Bdellovibrionales bacterium]